MVRWETLWWEILGPGGDSSCISLSLSSDTRWRFPMIIFYFHCRGSDILWQVSHNEITHVTKYLKVLNSKFWSFLIFSDRSATTRSPMSQTTHWGLWRLAQRAITTVSFPIWWTMPYNDISFVFNTDQVSLFTTLSSTTSTTTAPLWAATMGESTSGEEGWVIVVVVVVVVALTITLLSHLFVCCLSCIDENIT